VPLRASSARSWWTTCDDSVRQTEDLLRELDVSLCYDPRSVYAVGVSNGGMFLYELASSYLSRAFAAFMPIVGSPHHGFNRPPLGAPVPFLGIWGRHDIAIPPFANPTAQGHPGGGSIAVDTHWSGWLYASADAVTGAWADANGCANASSEPTVRGCGGSEVCELGNAAGSVCTGWSFGCASGASVLRCIHPGGHDVPPWVPQALWAFMQEHPTRRIARAPETAASSIHTVSASFVLGHAATEHGAAFCLFALAGVASLVYVARRHFLDVRLSRQLNRQPG
jgi:poly(3-hydroxybutyrate) depolymerase